MKLETTNVNGEARRGLLLALILGIAMTCFSVAFLPASRAYAEEVADVAGLRDAMQAEAMGARIQITTNQQSDTREVDFVSVCAESGEIDVEMTITYANGEPANAHEPNYLYVRLDVDGEAGFKWLSPVVDGDNTLIYNFFLDKGKRAAFWIFDYPKDDKETETAPTLKIVATDRKGRQVYGTTVGAFRSSLEEGGDGTFFLGNARVDADAEDKAGLPNAKILLSVLGDDDGQSTPDPDNPDSSDSSDGEGDGEGSGPNIGWDDGDKRKGTDGNPPQTGDATVIYTLVAIVVSLVAFIVASRRRK